MSASGSNLEISPRTKRAANRWAYLGGFLPWTCDVLCGTFALHLLSGV